ncbi:MAG: hypothetical protein JNK82_18355 [Myxococcaceae bacterium]|nr:hypothetical protein [Myxococcaceae bacterium]
MRRTLPALALLAAACPLGYGTPPLYGCTSDDECVRPLTCRGGLCAGETGGGLGSSDGGMGDGGTGGSGGQGGGDGGVVENPVLDFVAVGTITAARCVPATLTLGGAARAHTVTFSSMPAGVTFWADAACTQALPSLTVQPVMLPVTLYIRALTAQGYTVTATSTTVPVPATVTVTVLPIVRSGTCTVPGGVGTVQCPITPQQENLNETFFVYQASGSAMNDYASVATRCTLASASQVVCDRAGTTGEVYVTWQTAEVPGLDVQRADLTCDGSATRTLTFPRAIDPARSFATYAVRQTGAYFSANDAFAATLFDAGVAFTWATACDESATLTAQVVQWPGAVVARATLGVDGGQGSVTSPMLATAQSAFSLATWSTAASIADAPCGSTLRVSVPAARTVAFARGAASACTGPELPRVAYERVDLGARGRVQQVTLDMADGVAMASAVIQPVDPTRTLVLAGGQTGGQGLAMGEGLLETPSAMGDFAATLRLAGNQVIGERKSTRSTSRWSVFVVELSP